ncbi:MAG: MBL fold metallo-hydrolase [Polyangiaceae bacterium]
MRGGTSVIVSLWLVLGAAACVPAPRLSGPPTDHFADGSFRNLARFDPPGITDLLEWAVTGDAVTWPEWVEIPDARPPPARVTQGLRVTFVNHATVLVQMSGVNVLTDPVWSERVGPAFWIGPRRHKDPGIRFEDLPPIDAIVISHNHYDHLDGPTIARVVERDMPVVLAGLGTEKLLAELGIGQARALDLDWWQSRRVKDVTVTFTPAQHWSTRTFTDRFATLWGSFFVSDGKHSVYFAGDTGMGPHFSMIRERLGPPTVALLPIGAYRPRWFMRPQHIDPIEAVAAHRALGAARSVGIHWGTFDLADEGMDEPAEDLARASAAAGLAPGAFITLENGGSAFVP